MTNLYSSDLYIKDIAVVANTDIPWYLLQDKSILITGATGLIGSFLIDVIMHKNIRDHLNCTILAVGRDRRKAEKRFDIFFKENNFEFIECDINHSVKVLYDNKIDYMVHLASNTHPLAYASDPIGTISSNIIGTNNLLECSSVLSVKRFIFASSNEIYGENRGDVELFDEEYCGYINSNTLRAGYPESKRCGEALCQAYRVQKNMDVVIARLTRSYGPTMKMDDSKALSQFIKNGLEGQNIILKSDGSLYYSYTYVADAVSGLLTVLLKGINGDAYNIAYQESDIKLKDLAELIAEYSGTKVVHEIPSALEKSGYSTATKARLSGAKLKQLGWTPLFDIREGIRHTLNILKSN